MFVIFNLERVSTFQSAKLEVDSSGSLRTEPGTGNRTDLEPEPAEPDTEPELAELEPEKNNKIGKSPKIKKVQKPIQNQTTWLFLVSRHHGHDPIEWA